MSFVHAVLLLTLIWAAIHTIRYLLTPSRAHSLLPSASSGFRSRRHKFWNTATTQVFLNSFHLRFQTTTWNLHHDVLATELKKDRKLSQALKTFYDLGIVFGLLGMLTGLALLSWTCGLSTLFLSKKIMKYITRIPSSVSPGLVRRGLESATVSLPEDESFIKLIIPGLTVPLAHLPLILTSVFFAQIVHEFGHAVTAALESVPLLFTGASFTFVIPSAFVTLSAAVLTELTPRKRLRIIAAGPFHNILLWSILFFVQRTGVGSVFWTFAYRDTSTLGMVVLRVDSSSPLHDYIPPATVITKLDDTSLGSGNPPADLWTPYLTGTDDRWQKGLGWCADTLADPESCCANEKTSLGLSCFESTDDPSHRGCMDPIPMLTTFSDSNRCSSTVDCFGDSICVRPDKTRGLLRLTVHRPSSLSQDVVLWSGPLREVWEQIAVGTLIPRYNILPLWLPSQAEYLWEYLMMATLSLFIFNLLPLPLLDGSQFLRTLPQLAWGRHSGVMTEEYDLESLQVSGEMGPGPGSGRGEWWSDQLVEVIPKVTIGLFGGCLVLGLINVIW